MSKWDKYVTIKGEAIFLKHCETCNIVREPRSFHCDICDNCIRKHGKLILKYLIIIIINNTSINPNYSII